MTEDVIRERAARLSLELIRADEGYCLRTPRGAAITGKRRGVPLERVAAILGEIERMNASVLADRRAERAANG